jgi:hypothetical protein
MDAPRNAGTAAVRADLGFWRDLVGGDDEAARDLLTHSMSKTRPRRSR